MVRKTNRSVVQLSLFPEEEASVKDINVKEEREKRLQSIKSYMHTREGLWRLITCCPADMPVAEAVSVAPSLIFGLGQEGGAA